MPRPAKSVKRSPAKTKSKREFLDEWVQALNSDGRFGKRTWAVSKNPADVKGILEKESMN